MPHLSRQQIGQSSHWWLLAAPAASAAAVCAGAGTQGLGQVAVAAAAAVAAAVGAVAAAAGHPLAPAHLHGGIVVSHRRQGQSRALLIGFRSVKDALVPRAGVKKRGKYAVTKCVNEYGGQESHVEPALTMSGSKAASMDCCSATLDSDHIDQAKSELGQASRFCFKSCSQQVIQHQDSTSQRCRVTAQSACAC